MRKHIKIGLLLFSVALTCSCASGPGGPVEWGYEKNGIQLYLTADSQLNLYQGIPHTLYLCVYQLKDPNAFNELTRNEEGLAKLLGCTRFDASVARSHSLTLHPGEALTEMLDRADGAKYVGLVAGYYSFEKENMTRLFEVPVGRNWYLVLEPKTLTIDLYFGPNEIKGSEGR